MGVNLERFNRIIDLAFFTGDGDAVYVKCPRHGQKPKIEINGTFTTGTGGGMNLPVIDITAKNLYLDLRNHQYSRIRIKAGYANNLITIDAEINTMFQEGPGPEGTTVIQCLHGSVSSWLDSYVKLSFKSGTKIEEVINAIKTKLKVTDVIIGKVAREQSLPVLFQYQGTARGAMSYLEQLLADKKLMVFMQGTTLCAVCCLKGDYVKSHILQYLSATPQQNPGDEEGMYRTQITAPWMPELNLGDMLESPSQVYIKNGSLVGGANKRQKMIVTGLSFHFGTTGSVNSMTADGYIKRDKNG